MARPVPRGSSSSNSPGISGAIKDAVRAVALTYGPKSVTQAARHPVQSERSNEEASLGRMRAAQSTDSDNAYTL